MSRDAEVKDAPVQMDAQQAAAWAAGYNSGVAAEREACASICEFRANIQRMRSRMEGNDYAAERAVEAEGCGAAIRARSNT